MFKHDVRCIKTISEKMSEILKKMDLELVLRTQGSDKNIHTFEKETAFYCLGMAIVQKIIAKLNYCVNAQKGTNLIDWRKEPKEILNHDTPEERNEILTLFDFFFEFVGDLPGAFDNWHRNSRQSSGVETIGLWTSAFAEFVQERDFFLRQFRLVVLFFFFVLHHTSLE